MCIDPNWMPFEKFDDRGNHIGITADYYKIFSKTLGIDFNILKTKTWDESLQNAINRKCDILSLAMETPSRKKYFNFTSEYLKIPIVLATKLDVPFIDNIEAIKNKKVGITKGELKITGKLDKIWALGIAVRNDDINLLNILEKVIKSIDTKKEQEILNTWISIKYEKAIDYSLLWRILIAVTFLILLFIYIQYSLKKANKNLQIAVDNKTKDLQKLNNTLESKIKEEVKKNLEIQEKLFKSEKMASMGEMIGNIAHQWRQPLSIISAGATGMLMQKKYDLLNDKIFEETCTDINNNAQYLSKTIDDFKNFIKGDRKRVIFNLKDNIDSFLSLVKSSIVNNNIKLVLDVAADINVFTYPNELIQCFMNIFNNAKDALIQNNEKDRLILISAFIENENITIKIQDNAGGINTNIIQKVFEPYFTTKHKSKGTGIGLHMTYNLVVNGMHGMIEVKNEKFIYNDKSYTGALFLINLPKNLT